MSGGGARVSSGTGSQQYYGTPTAFLTAVQKRFGPIILDLAADASNTKHARYFAPTEFVETIVFDKEPDLNALALSLIARGASQKDVNEAIESASSRRDEKKLTIRIKNSDPNPVAFDSLKQSWADISSSSGLLWLNPEFADITPWAKKCADEGAKGARIAFLVPASVGSNWYADYVHDKALVLFIRPRLSFDGKAPYPKDCLAALYGFPPDFETWDWKA